MKKPLPSPGVYTRPSPPACIESIALAVVGFISYCRVRHLFTTPHQIIAIEVRDVKNTDVGTDNKHASPPRSASSRKTTTALILIVCTLATGCIVPKRASFVVPRRCMKINVQSFTRPCVQRADGKLVCDGVVVTATCLEAPH